MCQSYSVNKPLSSPSGPVDSGLFSVLESHHEHKSRCYVGAHLSALWAHVGDTQAHQRTASPAPVS